MHPQKLLRHLFLSFLFSYTCRFSIASASSGADPVSLTLRQYLSEKSAGVRIFEKIIVCFTERVDVHRVKNRTW